METLDFRSAAEEISRLEKDALDYKPPEGKAYTAERVIEFSPTDILDMEYSGVVSQYDRLEKILSASSVDIGLMGTGVKGEEAAAPAPAHEPTEESSQVAEAMKKISAQSARESDMLYMPQAPKEAPQKAAPKPAIPKAAAPAGEIPPELEAQVKAELEGAPAPKEEKPTKAMPKPEEAEAPEKPSREEEEMEEKVMEKMPPAPEELVALRQAPAPPRAEIEEAPLEIPLPQMLTESPEKSGHETFTRIEQQFQAQVTTGAKAQKKVDVEGAKKRMMELTRELFRERSMDRREEIKKEIVMLKNLLSGSKETGGAGAAAAPTGALLSALKSDQEYEVSSAKKFIQEIFARRSKELIETMKTQIELRSKEEAVESYSKNMVNFEQKLMEIVDKYSAFLISKHSFELSDLAAEGQFVEEAEKAKAAIRENYSHEFSTLKSRIGEEINSQLGAAKAVLEAQGDPKSRSLAQVRGADDEELLHFLQAKDPRSYEKYARGETGRSETLALARRLMALDAGLDEDTINKYFGVK